MDNKNLGLKYYDDMKDAYLSDLLIQASINAENQLMAFSRSIWQYFPDTGRSTGSYIIFYQGGQIDLENMFQDQFLNQVQKVTTMKHALQECLYHIPGY